MYKLIIKKAPIHDANFTGLTQFQQKLDKITHIMMNENICTLDFSFDVNNTLYLDKIDKNNLILDIKNLNINGTTSMKINIFIDTTLKKQYIKTLKINGINQSMLNLDIEKTIDASTQLILQEINLIYINSQISKVITTFFQYLNDYQGLYFKIYDGYMNNDTNYFKNKVHNNDGYTANFTNMHTATSKIINVDNRDNYSIEWYGYFIPPETGLWTFNLASDDCSYLWLGEFAKSGYNISNALVYVYNYNNMIPNSGSVNLIAGETYPIRIQYGESIYGNNIFLSLKSPSELIYSKNIPFYSY